VSPPLREAAGFCLFWRHILLPTITRFIQTLLWVYIHHFLIFLQQHRESCFITWCILLVLMYVIMAWQQHVIALADVEAALVNLGQFSLSHPLASWDVIQGMIIRHYTRQLLQEIYKVV
jgi:hypothetical protein